MNNDREHIRQVIKEEANRVSSVVSIVGVAVIIFAICLIVVGVCWAGAWMMVNITQ